MSAPIELGTADQSASAGYDRLSSTTDAQLELRLSDCLRWCHSCGSPRKPLHNSRTPASPAAVSARHRSL